MMYHLRCVFGMASFVHTSGRYGIVVVLRVHSTGLVFGVGRIKSKILIHYGIQSKGSS